MRLGNDYAIYAYLLFYRFIINKINLKMMIKYLPNFDVVFGDRR